MLQGQPIMAARQHGLEKSVHCKVVRLLEFESVGHGCFAKGE